MNASLEITSGILRLGDDHAQFGDPFTTAVSFIGDEGVATIKGLAGHASRALVGAMLRALQASGFREARWVRHEPSGEVREVRIDLTRRIGL